MDWLNVNYFNCCMHLSGSGNQVCPDVKRVMGPSLVSPVYSAIWNILYINLLTWTICWVICFSRKRDLHSRSFRDCLQSSSLCLLRNSGNQNHEIFGDTQVEWKNPLNIQLSLQRGDLVDPTGFKPAIILPCKGSGFDHSHHGPKLNHQINCQRSTNILYHNIINILNICPIKFFIYIVIYHIFNIFSISNIPFNNSLL